MPSVPSHSMSFTSSSGAAAVISLPSFAVYSLPPSASVLKPSITQSSITSSLYFAMISVKAVPVGVPSGINIFASPDSLSTLNIFHEVSTGPLDGVAVGAVVGVIVGAGVFVGDGVFVGADVGVIVAVGVGVGVTVGVAVGVSVGVGVAVTAGVAVGVGSTSLKCFAADIK